MEEKLKRERYQRILLQFDELFEETEDTTARMATAAAVLHAKMPHFFWTGFYLLRDGRLTVGPYQGSLACLVLKAHTGVCWAAIDGGEAVIVADVHNFPGHIACDARTKSEIVVPVRHRSGTIVGVLDVDAETAGAFDDVDRAGLEAIAARIISGGEERS
jgi:L-methionine (R)-S-oxide reductase